MRKSGNYYFFLKKAGNFEYKKVLFDYPSSESSLFEVGVSGEIGNAASVAGETRPRSALELDLKYWTNYKL